MYASLMLVAAALVALGLFVWLSRKDSDVSRWFAISAISSAGWTVGVAGAHSGIMSDISLRLGFAGASVALPAFLAFVQTYPVPSAWPSSPLLRIICLTGIVFALISLTTALVAYQPSLSPAGLARKTGVLYPFFAVYCFLTLCAALALLLRKWHGAT